MNLIQFLLTLYHCQSQNYNSFYPLLHHHWLLYCLLRVLCKVKAKLSIFDRNSYSYLEFACLIILLSPLKINIINRPGNLRWYFIVAQYQQICIDVIWVANSFLSFGNSMAEYKVAKYGKLIVWCTIPIQLTLTLYRNSRQYHLLYHLYTIKQLSKYTNLLKFSKSYPFWSSFSFFCKPCGALMSPVCRKKWYGTTCITFGE